MSAGLRVLLVEDNPGDVEMVRRALRNHAPPVSLEVAPDGLDALAMLRPAQPRGADEAPDIILLDLNMPRMDGKSLLETLKADAGLRSIPVVMLTSSQSPADIRECYERQASFYVVKPFEGATFTATLRQVIRHWMEVAELPGR
jgi:CheY-like chemotaxis protein